MKNKILVLGITALILGMLVLVTATPGNSGGNGKGKRVIADTTSPIDKFIFRMKGCTIVHELNDATALECPEGVQIEGAFEDEVYHIMDTDANVQINADDVWVMDPPITGAGVTVAVLDTGIDKDHPELISSIVGGKGFGYPDYEDDNGHGTHVAGIITSDGTVDGLSKGAAPGAGVWVAKVLGSSGSGWSTDIAAAIEYVVEGDDGIPGTDDEPAEIISMSLGGGGTGGPNCNRDYLAQKVNWAVDNGVTVVVAAGNTAGVVSSPACASGAIAVGAVDKNDVRAYFSGTGKALDIMAPGVIIYSTVIGGYGYKSGTSMATPHVSATVALMEQKNPTWTDADIKEALYNTAVDLGLSSREQGNGRVDAYAAVNYGTTTTTIPEGCGDGYCAGSEVGEDCYSCSKDCACRGKDCSKGCCGNEQCEEAENSKNCPVDCGAA